MKLWKAAIIVAAVLLMVTPEGLDSCGIGPQQFVFAASSAPADPAAFRNGKVGVVRRSYRGQYLLAAYRILSGVPLTDQEARALIPKVLTRSERYQSPDVGLNWWATPGRDAWNAQREKLRAAGPIPYFEPHKEINDKGLIYSFANCLDDAFANAAGVLTELQSGWGAADPRTIDWARTQDEVFTNCSSQKPRFPPEPAPGMDPKLAQYRKYQIAAAYFYGGEYRKASAVFDQIAGDSSSPWHDMAPYLAGRALLRAGMIGGDMQAYRDGKERLMAIVNDPRQKSFHEMSLGLLHLWQLRAEPQARLAELSAELMQPADQDKSQAAIDFLYAAKARRDGNGREWSPEEITRVEEANPMAAWVMAMSQKPPQDSEEQAMEWLRKTGKPVWLIPALANWDEKNRDELLRAAKDVTPADPAAESVAYYMIYGELAHGHKESARLLADRALARKLQLATRNLILDERIKLAHDTAEFLQFALKQPEPKVVFYDYSEEPSDPPPGWAWMRMLDSRSASQFNYRVPLAQWLEATVNKSLPAALRLQMAQCGWVRARMLGRTEDARIFLERVVELNPRAADLAGAILNAKTPEESRFAVAYVALRVPDLGPMLPGADDRSPAFTDARYYGWNRFHTPPEEKELELPFLTQAQRADNAGETKQFEADKTWNVVAWLQQSLDWARLHPDDPRVPEALHRAIHLGFPSSSLRPGEKPSEYGRLSKAAFDVLHQKYATSPWTAKTPVWYN